MQRKDETVRRTVAVPVGAIIATSCLIVSTFVVALALLLVFTVRSSEVDQTTREIESLNGSVGVNGLCEVVFSASGREPLITDDSLRELAPALGRAGVQYMGLGGTQVSDDGLAAVAAHCKDSLRHLEISGSRVTAVGLTSLVECTRLRRISLSADALTGPGLDAIVDMPQITELTLFGIRDSDWLVMKLQEARPDITIAVYSHKHFMAPPENRQ